MKKTVLLSILLFSVISLWAQDELLIDKAGDKTLVPVKLLKLGKADNSDYQATLMTQFTGQDFKTTGILVHGAETSIITELRTMDFHTDGSFRMATNDFYTAEGGMKKLSLYGEEQVNTLSHAEVMDKYPEIFKKCSYITIKDGISSASVTEYEKELFSLGFTKKDVEHVMLHHPDKDTRKKEITYSQKFQIDAQNEYVTTFFGNKDVANKDNKYNELKDYDFYTFNLKGEIVNTFNVKFPYPMQLSKSMLVYSEEDPSKVAGKVFIFFRAMLFGKKYGDPEKNNYDIVYTTPDGALILYKHTKLGTVEKPHITIEAAYGNATSVKLFGNAKVEDVLKAGVIAINSDGSESIHTLTSDEVKENTVYIKDTGELPEVEDRDILGAASTPGYKFTLGSDFIPSGMIKASNGDLILYGQNVYEVSDPNPPAPPPGTTTMGAAPKLKKYSEFIAIQIGSDNTPKKFYLAKLPVTSEAGTFSVMEDKGGKLLIAVSVPHVKLGENEKKVSSMFTSDGTEIPFYTNQYYYYPRVCVIDPATTEAKAVGYDKETFLFDLKNSYFVDSENSKLVIAGFTNSVEEGKRFALKLAAY